MSEQLFGLNVPTTAARGSDPVGTAVRAEALGFDFVSSSDHPIGAGPSFETWTMLCFISAATTRIRIATRVLGVPYRNPALLAKMAETLSRLSNGRLILGLGSGSADEEQRALGLDVRSPKEKTDGLEEAVTIVRGLWSDDDFSFEGRLYRTERATLDPRPSSPIPIWLGTFAPRALAITGRLADGWIPSLGYASEADLVRMRHHLMAAAERAGRAAGEIKCVLNTQVQVAEKAAGDVGTIAGSPAEIVEQLVHLCDLGFTSFNFSVVGAGVDRQTERLAEEVLPVLRERQRCAPAAAR